MEIICNHIPQWFDKEFAALKLEVRLEESIDELCHAVVSCTGIRIIQTSGLNDGQQECGCNGKMSSTSPKTDIFKCGGSRNSHARGCV